MCSKGFKEKFTWPHLPPKIDKQQNTTNVLRVAILVLTNFLGPNLSRDVAKCWMYAFQKTRGYKSSSWRCKCSKDLGKV